MEGQMEILLKTEKKPEVEAVLQLLEEMTTEEQEKMLVFVQALRFAKGLWEKSNNPS